MVISSLSLLFLPTLSNLADTHTGEHGEGQLVQVGQLVLVRRLLEVADLGDVDDGVAEVVLCARFVSNLICDRSKADSNLLAPRFMNPSISKSPSGPVFGESSGMTKPYVVAAVLVFPKKALASTSIWLSERD